MRFNNEEDDDRADYFDGPDIPEEKKPEKKPEYTPDDPLYWEEEHRWEHLRPRRLIRLYFIGGGVVVAIIALILLWWRFFNPYVEEASQYGYIDHVEKRGVVFKTYEATLIPYKNIMDTTRVYDGDFTFSASSEVGAKLRRFQHSGIPVKVEYKTYHATVPWRGDSKTVVTDIDSVDPAIILPPDRNHITEETK